MEVKATLTGAPPKIEYVLASFVFEGGKPDYAHAPCLKREDEDVIGDRVFHSPAVVLQKQRQFAALAPDLDILNDQIVYAHDTRPNDGPRKFRIAQDPARLSMPTALDLDMQPGLGPLPVFSYGFADYLVQQHMYWKHINRDGAFVRELSAGKLHFGFDLFVSATSTPLRGYSEVSRHMWRRYGATYVRRPRPQTMPFSEYAAACYPPVFAYRGDTEQDTQRYADGKGYDAANSGPLPTWLDFEIDGKPAGGVRATPQQWYNDVQFMGWWNNIHLALGFYYWGQRNAAPDLIDKARRIVNLAVSAPRNQGIFPAVYNYRERRWVGCYWKPDAPYNAAVLPKYWDFNSDYYQTCSASKTAALLLRYDACCEHDPRIVEFVKPYGDFIAGRLDRNGCLPAWFTKDLEPVPYLRFNAEAGIHIRFLSELYRVTRDTKYWEAAQRLTGFLVREIFPEQRWYDFETFYSCSSKPEGTFDARTGQWPRCTLSMIWAIEGLAALSEAGGGPEVREALNAASDYAAFYQSVWQPHFIITAYAFGGYVSQNTDAEWLDMRQCVFAEAMARAALVTGRQDLFERSVAALHASFAIVNHPRHIENGIFRQPSYPFGICAENIDHEGLPQLPLRSGSDWGEGGALAAAAELLRLLGGARIDFNAGTMVGVDGVWVKTCRRDGRTLRVEIDNQIASLPVPYEKPITIDLMMVGLPPESYDLILNRDAPRTVTLDLSGRLPIVIQPHRNQDARAG